MPPVGDLGNDEPVGPRGHLQRRADGGTRRDAVAKAAAERAAWQAVVEEDAVTHEPGPHVGEPIPSFEAPDQWGRKQTLATVRGPRGAAIVFIRSADW